MEKANFIERFKNPAIILSILGVFVWITLALNTVDVNKKEIRVLEDRLQKKIEMLNTLNKNFYEYKLDQKDHEIDMMKEIHRLELQFYLR